MNKVFISHSTKDDSFIDKLVGELQNNGIQTFVDHHNIQIADNWATSISNALDECEQMIVVISPDSCDSKMCLKEWIYFTDRDKEIIPIKYKETDKFPFLFVDLQWVDMESADKYDINVSKLVEFIDDDIVLYPTDSSAIKSRTQSLPESDDQLPAQLLLRHPITRSPNQYVGIATGNIAEIKGVDVIINSENDRLRMARPEEKSVSAALNAFSMKYNPFENTEECPVEDALSAYRNKVNIARFPSATVVETISGQLLQNGIRHILHAVSVESAGYEGKFTPFSNLILGRCVTNSLKKIDELNSTLYPSQNDIPLTRIVFPIFGTGDAGGDIHDIAPRLIENSIEYLEINETLIKEVYFVAFTQKHLEKLQQVFNKYTGDNNQNPDLGDSETVNIFD